MIDRPTSSFIYLFVCLKMITLYIYSHILVAPGVGFLLLCLAWGSAWGFVLRDGPLFFYRGGGLPVLKKNCSQAVVG